MLTEEFLAEALATAERALARLTAMQGSLEGCAGQVFRDHEHRLRDNILHVTYARDTAAAAIRALAAERRGYKEARY